MSNIALLRKEKKITQDILARKLGIAQSTLSQYENDKRIPDSKTLIMLSEIFGVTPNYILGVPDSPPKMETQQSLINATKVVEVSDELTVNTYLQLGWKLLYIGQVSDSGTSNITYVLGWFGDLDLAKTLEPRNNEDTVESW